MFIIGVFLFYIGMLISLESKFIYTSYVNSWSPVTGGWLTASIRRRVVWSLLLLLFLVLLFLMLLLVVLCFVLLCDCLQFFTLFVPSIIGVAVVVNVLAACDILIANANCGFVVVVVVRIDFEVVVASAELTWTV